MALFFVRGWLCRFSKSACFLFAKVLVNWVCKIILASLALSFYGKVKFSKVIVLVCLAESFFSKSFGKLQFFWFLLRVKFVQ